MGGEKTQLEDYFLAAEVSKYLKELVKEALYKISRKVNLDDISFGCLYEGPTLTEEIAEVSEDGDIRINSERLQPYAKNVSMALIAHEIAHVYHKHFRKVPSTLHFEKEADETAQKWGFDIDAFRNVMGPPTM